MDFVILHATATSDRAHNGHFRKEIEILIFPNGFITCMIFDLCRVYIFCHTEKEIQCSTELPLVQAI